MTLRKLLLAAIAANVLTGTTIPAQATEMTKEMLARFQSLAKAQWAKDHTCHTMIEFTGTLETDPELAVLYGLPARLAMAEDFVAWQDDDRNGLGPKHPKSLFNWSICKGDSRAATFFEISPQGQALINRTQGSLNRPPQQATTEAPPPAAPAPHAYRTPAPDESFLHANPGALGDLLGHMMNGTYPGQTDAERSLDASCKDMGVAKQRQYGLYNQCQENHQQLVEKGGAR